MASDSETDANYETRLYSARSCTYCSGSTRRTPMTLFNTCSELRGRFSNDVGKRLCKGFFCSFECMLGNACDAAVPASDYELVKTTIHTTAGYPVEPACRGPACHDRVNLHAAARTHLSARQMRCASEWDENYIGAVDVGDVGEGDVGDA